MSCRGCPATCSRSIFATARRFAMGSAVSRTSPIASDQVTVFKALGGGWEQAPPMTPLPIADGKSGKDAPVR
jgi:hypothetical protein